MGNSFKAIVQGKTFYREIELPDQAETISFGTERGCGIRLNREAFFADFTISFTRMGKFWQLECSQQVFIATQGAMKQYDKQMSHGDSAIIKYNGGQELFRIDFWINFEDHIPKFERFIDVSTVPSITIGSGNRDVQINDGMVTGYVSLVREGNGYRLTEHHLQYGVYVNGGKINQEALLQHGDFFSICGYFFYISGNRLFTAIHNNMQIPVLHSTDNFEQLSHLAYPDFNRSTRVKYKIPEEEIEIQSPSQKPQRQKRNLLFSLIPALGMLLLTIVLRGVMSSSSNSLFVVYSVCTMSIGILMSVFTFFYEEKQYKKNLLEREEKYQAYMAKKEAEIKALRDYELSVRRTTHTSIAENIREAKSFGKKLFEKSWEDEDFLDVMVGTGQVEASCKVTYTKQDYVELEDDLIDLPAALEQKYHYFSEAPIVSRGRVVNAVGFVGNEAKQREAMLIFSLDIALRHFYDDVKMFYIINEADETAFQFLRWLKHTHNEHVQVRNFIYDEESKKVVLELIYAELVARERRLAEEKDVRFPNHYVIFVFDRSSIVNHPVSRYIESAAVFGVTFLFFVPYEELLPKGCGDIILLEERGAKGTIVNSADGTEKRGFTYQPISESQAARVALRLGAVQVDEITLDSELTKNITLFQLLEIVKPDDLDLSARWDASQVFRTMAAPLGVKVKNEVVYLDISDKASGHGPHGLVAGTTGSGKSEILQSYMLSMASLFSPDDVGFVIIDFKGGGMSNQFDYKDKDGRQITLPHLIGTITNIDGREINRSLLSIKAELHKRQEMFAQHNVNHINDYIRLYKKKEAKQALPHLIMIVDEFAELKHEYPDFMSELISAARIGRTLGVHLILATQKPDGVVDPQIWSNSKFKLCLKVQTKEDSLGVIKTPLAAEIVEPGRAYFQVGNNEIFELFQSAYSGARVPSLDEADDRVYEIFRLNTWGKRDRIFTSKKKGSDEEAMNQLQALVTYMNDYCQQNGVRRLPGICLPPLKEKLFLRELRWQRIAWADGITVPVGIYDAPQHQLQETLILSLTASNTYIIGSAQSGKTSFLQTVLYTLIEQYGPAEVNAYIIDCGNMALKVFEGAKQVGGVVTTQEEERIVNLFKLLTGQIKKRKVAFAAKGLGTYRSYVEAGGRDIPQIFVVIDNISAFREYYPDFDDELLLLSREGLSVGINLIVTAASTNAIGHKVLPNYGTRFAFHCNDSGEYSNLFDRCRVEPLEVPGRGLCVVDKTIFEFQAALCVEGEKEFERVNRLKQFVEDSARKYPDAQAQPIPEVPAMLRRSDIMRTQKSVFMQPYQIPLGMRYDTVELEMLDLLNAGLLGITGREKSGKTNFVMSVLSSLQTTILKNPVEAFILDSTFGQLQPCKERFAFVKKYTVDITDTEAIVELLCTELEGRQAMAAESRGKTTEEVLRAEPLLLLVIENQRIFEELARDKALSGRFMSICKQYRKFKVMVIFSNLENSAPMISAHESLKQMKDQRLLAFDDISNVRFVSADIKQQRLYPNPIRLGDAYLFHGGEARKLKTILND